MCHGGAGGHLGGAKLVSSCGQRTDHSGNAVEQATEKGKVTVLPSGWEEPKAASLPKETLA